MLLLSGSLSVIIRKLFLVKRPQRDHHSLSYRLVIFLVLIHGFHKKPTVGHPRRTSWFLARVLRTWLSMFNFDVFLTFAFFSIFRRKRSPRSAYIPGNMVFGDRAESELVVLSLPSEQGNASSSRQLNFSLDEYKRQFAFDLFAKISHGITTEGWPVVLVTVAYIYIYICVYVCRDSRLLRVPHAEYRDRLSRTRATRAAAASGLWTGWHQSTRSVLYLRISHSRGRASALVLACSHRSTSIL